jgi:hypothetical protein
MSPVASLPIPRRRGARPGDVLPLLGAAGPAVLLGAALAGEPVAGD